MGTFNDKHIIDELIANNGHYHGDPQAVKIVEYTNFAGGICWGVVYESEPLHMWNRYEIPSPYINNPKVIFRATSNKQGPVPQY